MAQLRKDERDNYDALMSEDEETIREYFEEYEIKLTPTQKYITAKNRGMKHVMVIIMIAENRKLPERQQAMLKWLVRKESNENVR